MISMERFLKSKIALLTIIAISTILLTTCFILWGYSQNLNQIIFVLLSLFVIIQLFFTLSLRNSFFKFYLFQRQQILDLRAKNKHLLDTEANLIQAERDSSIGTLVACVSHEMNTPLGFIHSSLEFLNESLDELRLSTTNPETQPENVEPIFEDISEASHDAISGVNRVTEIVKSLKDFSRVDRADRDDIDIVSCFESSLMVIKHKIPNGVKLLKTYKGAPIANCSATQINQVFINLLNNALDAINEKGTIDIKIFSGSEFVNVFIEDDGEGISSDQLEKIFVPFHTTKSKGKGTGLGLYISKRIVDNHDGQLLVESDLGKGSTFVVRLPKVQL